MKKPPFPKWPYAVLRLLYIALCLAASVFYRKASFGIDAVRWCGHIWMYLTVVLCAVRLLHLIHPCRLYRKASLCCTALISCIQVLAIPFWLGLSDGRHTYIWSASNDVVDAVLITPRGALFHAAILLLGVVLLCHDSKLPATKKQP